MRNLLNSREFGLASIAAGTTLVAAGIPLAAASTTSALYGQVVAVVGVAWLLIGVVIAARSTPTVDKPVNSAGQGGRGGSASVGGNGVAIGGAGGRSGTGGSGGDGGGASVSGDGMAVAGSGGHAGEVGEWRPPAPSGYVIAARTQGIRPDPYLSQFGTGGVDPEYYAKLEVVRSIERAFDAPPTGFIAEAHPGLVPHINAVLEERGLNWRVRVDDAGFDYEFFRLRR